MSLENKEFQQRKEKVVSSLVEYVDPERRDKSPKGFIDEPILDLMHVINQHPDYYTTSSCSGRIAIYCEGLDEKTGSGTTKGGIWLYVSHDPITLPTTDQEIVNLLFGKESHKVQMNNDKSKIKNISQHQLIYFKFEPLILHIEASSQDTAMHLLSVANQIGYQNSGITPSKRHMLAIRSTLKIDTPIAYIENDKIYCLVEPSYLLLLLTMSNEKFEQNIKRMKIFEDTMKAELVKEQEKSAWEPIEVRRERMKREGLEKSKQNKKVQDVLVMEDLLDSVTL